MMRRIALIALSVVVAACSGGAEGGGEVSGADLANDLGCLACHTEANTDLAPTWNGLWGSEVELEDGATVVADAAYVRESIQQPQAKIVAGYGPTMPAMELTDEETEKLVEYIESLG